MKNPMLRSALVAAASAVVAIAIASIGTFVIPIPDREHVEFLYYVMLLIGLPVGTVLTLALRETLGTGGMWTPVVIAGLFAILNWMLVGILYGLLRQWLSKRKAQADSP